MNLKPLRTDASHPAFQTLVGELDGHLAVLNGEKNDFFKAFNQLTPLKQVIVVFADDQAVGCGALKDLGKGMKEIKRMFVSPSFRKKGIAQKILCALESWAKEDGALATRLETGVMMQEAVTLYQKNGYIRIPNYDPYTDVTESLCFEKKIN
jgi:putative acetyltransferase